MIKKSCLAVCLLASAASATEFDDKWQGSFTVASSKGQLTVDRTEKGITLTKNGAKGDLVPTLPLTNPKGSDDIKLKSTLTPRSFEKALSQAGEVVRIFPPALDEYIQASKTPPADVAQTEKERFFEYAKKVCGDSLSDEKTLKLWTNIEDEMSKHMNSVLTVVRNVYSENVLDASGLPVRYDVTKEINFSYSLKELLPNLDVKMFQDWHRSQNSGKLQGLNSEALIRYIDMGAALYNHNPSLVPQGFNDGVQVFKTDVAEMMKLRLQTGFQMSPIQEGQIDTLTLLDYGNHRTAVFATAKVVHETVS